MNIPPKYEDVVAQLEVERELHKLATETLGQFADENQKLHADLAALREELEAMTTSRDYCNRVALHNKEVGYALQQRLTVADQRSEALESAAREMLRIAGIANQGSNAYNRAIINLNDALKPAAEPDRPIIHNDPTPDYKLGPIIDAMRD